MSEKLKGLNEVAKHYETISIKFDVAMLKIPNIKNGVDAEIKSELKGLDSETKKERLLHLISSIINMHRKELERV